MTARILAAVLVVALAFAFAMPANAQTALCLPRPDMAKELADRFGEHPGRWAMTSGGALIELFESKSGSWTIAVTRPNGLTCLMAVGEDGWHRRPVAAPKGRT